MLEGYIGAVLSGVLAEYGLNVDIIDINPKTIEFYRNGSSPVNEPGLDKLVKKAVTSED